LGGNARLSKNGGGKVFLTSIEKKGNLRRGLVARVSPVKLQRGGGRKFGQGDTNTWAVGGGGGWRLVMVGKFKSAQEKILQGSRWKKGDGTGIGGNKSPGC